MLEAHLGKALNVGDEQPAISQAETGYRFLVVGKGHVIRWSFSTIIRGTAKLEGVFCDLGAIEVFQ